MSVHRRKWNRVVVALMVLSAIPAVLIAKGCSTTIANRNPTGEAFPVAVGKSLEKKTIELPAAFAGEPAILLVGYKQRAQFDIDRWMMGLLQSKADARIVELPTIPGLMPKLASGWIDDGMRSGIPREDWSSVVTLYGDAAKPMALMTGTEEGQLARILVLDPEGNIAWFDDKGYSAGKAMQVAELVARMNGA